jgi:hypothetical protein
LPSVNESQAREIDAVLLPNVDPSSIMYSCGPASFSFPLFHSAGCDKNQFLSENVVPILDLAAIKVAKIVK